MISALTPTAKAKLFQIFTYFFEMPLKMLRLLHQRIVIIWLSVLIASHLADNGTLPNTSLRSHQESQTRWKTSLLNFFKVRA